MSLRRILASAAVLAALAVVALFLFQARGGPTYHVHFTHAGLLVEGAEVMIGGRKAGKVTELSLTDSGEADVTISLDAGAPALRVGTTASLEEPSLSGQANRFIAVDPGPSTAPRLRDGDTITSAATQSVVEIDELYNLFDEETRDALQDVVHGQRDVFDGRVADTGRFYETFGPAVQASDRLFSDLAADGRSLKRFISATGELSRTLRASTEDLQGVVTESATTVSAMADGSEPLTRAIGLMPSTFAEGRRAFAELRAAVPTFETLVGRARVDLAGLPVFADSLTATLRSEDSLGSLAALLDGPARDDDLVDLVSGLPGLSRAALPAFRSSRPALRDGKPLIDQLRAYAPDLVSMWGNTGRALAPYDANGHYARILPQFGAFEERRGGDGVVRMHALAPDERKLGLQDGLLRRCPGSAAEPAADGSSPSQPPGVDCDLSQALR